MLWFNVTKLDVTHPEISYCDVTLNGKIILTVLTYIDLEMIPD